MAAVYRDDAHDCTGAVLQRRKPLMQRLFMGAATALVFSPLIGWEVTFLWAISYFAMQWIEVAVFAPLTRSEPEPIGQVRGAAGVAIMLGNALVYGGLSVPLWLEGGALGGICANILLCAGAIHAIIYSPGSKRVLCATLSSHLFYLLLTPWFIHQLGAPTTYVSASLVSVVTFIAYCLSTWGRMAKTRTSEIEARKVADRRREEAERAMAGRAAFLAAVGHDLRSPISAFLT